MAVIGYKISFILLRMQRFRRPGPVSAACSDHREIFVWPETGISKETLLCREAIYRSITVAGNRGLVVGKVKQLVSPQYTRCAVWFCGRCYNDVLSKEP